MNSREIVKNLNTFNPLKNIFLGVKAVNELPKTQIQEKCWCIVSNCCPRDLPGEHWVAIFCENNKIEFFDSYGLPPQFFDGIDTFLSAQQTNGMNKECVFNNQQLQSFDTPVCGHYCILYLKSRANHMSFERFIYILLNMDRDLLVKSIVNSDFGIY